MDIVNSEDFYYEEQNPKKVALFLVGLFVVFLLVACGFIYYRKMYTLQVKSKIYVEVGDTVSKDIRDYVKNKVVDKNDYSLYLNGVAISDNVFDVVGEYAYRVKYKSVTRKGKIIVQDTKAPEVAVADLKVGVDEEVDLNEFVTSCEDYSKPCSVHLKKEREDLTSKAGEFSLEIVIEDNYQNAVTKKVTLIVEEGYSRKEASENDLQVDHLESELENYKGELFIRYTKAVSEVDLEDDEEYQALVDMVTSDTTNYYEYMPDVYKLNRIDEFNLINVYNKYNYVVGVVLWVKLDNGTSLYLTK